MSKISLPYHLIIPFIISTIILGVLYIKRKIFFKNVGKKSFWKSLIVFFSFYSFIVGLATYTDISLQFSLQKFDLDNNGFFEGQEITPELKKVLNKLTSDTGRNFSVITGLIFSAVIAFAFFVLDRLYEFLKIKFTN